MMLLCAGSNLTTNLRDFFSRATTRKAAKKEEQDLKGFGGPGAAQTTQQRCSTFDFPEAGALDVLSVVLLLCIMAHVSSCPRAHWQQCGTHESVLPNQDLSS